MRYVLDNAGFRATLRRLRRGDPIIVVTGLPRSGTSLAMQMIEAGGIAVLTDGVRGADSNNPKGYFELAAVKQLADNRDNSWLRRAGGKAIKVISYWLTSLPERYDYRVVFMHRDLREVAVSQRVMLATRGEWDAIGDERMIALYGEHLENIKRFLRHQRFATLELRYEDVIHHPIEEASKINAFLGGGLDVARMAAVVDHELHRNRVNPQSS